MNCAQCSENLVAKQEALLEETVRQEMSQHIATCAKCRQEEAEMMQLHTRLLRDARTVENVNVADRVAQQIADRVPSIEQRTIIGKIFRWKPLAAAAAIIVGAVILSQWEWSNRAAADVLEKGAQVAHTSTTMHIQSRIRTLPRDNFDYISPDCDFVQVDLWRRGSGEDLQWRVEKSGRVAVMDGKAGYLLMKPSPKFAGMAIQGPRDVGAGFVEWLREFLDVEDVLQHEVKAAQQQGSTLTLTQEKAADGRKISVVTVEAKAQGDFTNDWCKNKSIVDSDNRRVYRFDASNNRLESIQVWIHLTPRNDVLVFEATTIEYPAELPAKLFAIDLPAGLQWQDADKLVPAAAASAPAFLAPEKAPEEIARGFFEAFARGDQDTLNVYMGIKIPIPNLDKFRDKKMTLTIVSIGKPFKSGRYPGWFVPYEIEFSDGKQKETKKMNLAVRNDNPAKIWRVDGGF